MPLPDEEQVLLHPLAVEIPLDRRLRRRDAAPPPASIARAIDWTPPPLLAAEAAGGNGRRAAAPLRSRLLRPLPRRAARRAAKAIEPAFEAARRAVAERLQRNREEAVDRLEQGRQLEGEGRLEEAFVAYGRSLLERPLDASPIRALERLALALRYRRVLAEVYEALLARVPEHPSRASLLRRAAQLRQAAEEAGEAPARAWAELAGDPPASDGPNPSDPSAPAATRPPRDAVGRANGSAAIRSEEDGAAVRVVYLDRAGLDREPEPGPVERAASRRGPAIASHEQAAGPSVPARLHVDSSAALRPAPANSEGASAIVAEAAWRGSAAPSALEPVPHSERVAAPRPPAESEGAPPGDASASCREGARTRLVASARHPERSDAEPAARAADGGAAADEAVAPSAEPLPLPSDLHLEPTGAPLAAAPEIGSAEIEDAPRDEVGGTSTTASTAAAAATEPSPEGLIASGHRSRCDRFAARATNAAAEDLRSTDAARIPAGAATEPSPEGPIASRHRSRGEGFVAPAAAPAVDDLRTLDSVRPSAADRVGLDVPVDATPRPLVERRDERPSLGSRLVAWTVDGALLAALPTASLFAATVSMGQTGLSWIDQLFHAARRYPSIVVAGLLLGLLTAFVYLTLCCAFGGRTIGGRVAGLQIVDPESDGPPDLRRAAIRGGWAILGSLPLFAGSLWAVVDAERQTFHDKVAGTRTLRR